ncbi:MAG: transporter associated domain-containing protein [Chloroflexota bacterium]
MVKLIRPVYFTPESKLVSKLFSEMRESNYRMAVVVDEYGGTAGIMSFARMAEEVIGKVGDELGTADKDFEIVNESTFQVDGSMRIVEVNEELKLSLPEGDYETVAGFVLSVLGHIPRQGEQLHYKNLKLTITRMQGVKIEEVLFTREEHGAIAP